MVDRVLPDFEYLATTVVDRTELPALLKEMFDMGYSAGKIDADLNWWERYDKDAAHDES